MKQATGYLVLEPGDIFPGYWHGGEERAGEVVFNTSHGGYEEMATDPSYFSQIIVLTAPQMGNYGADKNCWESSRIWIDGFVCLEMQLPLLPNSWQKQLLSHSVPTLSDVDTRKLTLRLRENGTPWGALVQADSPQQAQSKAKDLIARKKKLEKDWVHLVSCKEPQIFAGEKPGGPKVAILDFGCKTNTIRELRKRCGEVILFPSRTPADEIRAYSPDGIMLSNGPGDPAEVQMAVETVRSLLGWRFIFGICMGHQILGLALGGKTYRLKFGHRGSNHPIKDTLLQKIYVTSQNHGYNLDAKSLPATVEVTHTNLNDNTVSGIYDRSQKCMSVQFHPESHPGPHDAVGLFDFFIKQIT